MFLEGMAEPNAQTALFMPSDNEFILYEATQELMDAVEQGDHDAAQESILGYMTLYDGGYRAVRSVTAERGFGPLLYYLAMADGWLGPHIQDVSAEARKIWQKFYELDFPKREVKNRISEPYAKYQYKLPREVGNKVAQMWRNMSSVHGQMLAGLDRFEKEEFNTVIHEAADSKLGKEMKKIYGPVQEDEDLEQVLPVTDTDPAGAASKIDDYIKNLEQRGDLGHLEDHVKFVKLDRLSATQDWLSDQGGGDPVFPELEEYPVVARISNGELLILDGHHRLNTDVKHGLSSSQVYLFDIENLDMSPLGVVKQIEDIKRLAGVQAAKENLSIPGTARGEYQRKHNIRPGTDEWFKLWFSRPGITGENPTPRD